MSNQLNVVLNMSNLSVPQKLNKAQMIMANITANPSSFPSSSNLLTELGSAITALQAAYMDAADGAHSKVAFMHDREKDLMDVMKEVALFVGKLSKADAGIVHLAGLEARHGRTSHTTEFSAARGAQPGSVQLQSKAYKGVFYKWQYSTDVTASAGWVDALVGHVSHVLVNNIPAGFYWFRVVLVDAGGERPGAPLRVAVN